MEITITEKGNQVIIKIKKDLEIKTYSAEITDCGKIIPCNDSLNDGVEELVEKIVDFYLD